jgi:5-methylcytosine-specific restriction protein B
LHLIAYYLRHGKEKIEKLVRDAITMIENCAEGKECNKVNLYISAGDVEHWMNSLDYALKNGGFLLWGQRIEESSDLAKFYLGEKISRRAPQIGYERKFIASYLDRDPVINVFYVNNVGIVGVGVVTTILYDVYNIFWKREVEEKEVIFPFRWLSKVLWLHESVRKNPKRPERWSGLNLPRRKLGRLSGLQPISDIDNKRELSKILAEYLTSEFKETQKFLLSPLEKPVETSKGFEFEQSCIISIDNIDKIKEEIKKELIVDDRILDQIISTLAFSCQNVLLVGKPGTGKTTLARLIAEKLNFKPVIVTAHAHWSRHDVIGGLIIKKGNVVWRPGVLFKALVEHFKAKEEGFQGAWLIIDEVNRADVDKAFGEFFTIFSGSDPSEWIIPFYIVDEIKAYEDEDEITEEVLKIINRLERAPSGYRVPQKFRIIATLNYVDVANLFTLGEAFTRRFAKIVVDYPSDLDEEYKRLLDKIAELPIWSDESESENTIKKLNDVVEKLKLKEVIKRLREIEGIAFGPAHLQLVLRSLVVYLKNRPKISLEELRDVVIGIIRSALSLSELWDVEVREKIDEVLKELKPS